MQRLYKIDHDGHIHNHAGADSREHGAQCQKHSGDRARAQACALRHGQGRRYFGGLRLGVQGGGCSGLSYNIRFDSQPRERDRVFEFDGVRLFVDPKSFLYLSGMVLDYEESLIKQGFAFVNPNSSKSCGCGSSFSA